MNILKVQITVDGFISGENLTAKEIADKISAVRSTVNTSLAALQTAGLSGASAQSVASSARAGDHSIGTSFETHTI